ncbi:hypothetical protein CARUB_v10021711mg [Capsella rubella]|uniref:Plant thionin family protein n=1 Tax=Capsella rubella TaxID=81985 RepID=R0GEG6_9BRAS|nr:uncharacterized protein LOC17896475 [Capsella rubella]EOA34202.1 hypothetical protein CARUB_v10021711mg [Capsella rubella]
MAAQTMKNICNVLMIVLLFTMMVSTTHANKKDMCIKHCIPRQCMNISNKATLPLCENACKKLCNKNEVAHEEAVIPRPECGGFFWFLC